MNTLSIVEQKNTEQNLLEFLLNAPGFNLLSNNEMEMLEKIMLVNNYATGHKFNSNQNIYLILDGEVAVTNKDESNTLHLDRLHTGEFFGLYTLIDGSKRSAKCTAVGSVRAASLPRTAFELLFRSNLPLSLHFQHIVTNQMLRDVQAPLTQAHSNHFVS